MAFPVPPNDPNTPIPNDPFYYPQQNNLQSDFGPLIIGTGLNIDYATGILSANDPGTPGGVTALLAGDGIFLTANTGVVTVSNTGVTDIVAGTGISVSNVGGTFTITNLGTSGGTGTVKQINTGGGLTGGPITDVGTIALTQTGVAAATYTNPTITVDEYGRITYAAPGSLAGYPVQAQAPLQSDGLLPSTLSIAAASTTACGAVRLNDTVTSTSTLQAATARSVKQAYDTATTASANATTALGLATSASSDASSALSAALSAQTDAANALTQAVIAQGTADGAVTDAATAQTTADCAFALATTATGTANTALNSADVRVPCSAFLQKGSLLVGCGAGTYLSVPVGSNGRVLTACSSCPSGVTWTTGGGGSGSGTVTCIETGTGLIGGPITTVGVVAIGPTGVTPGIYTNPVLEINSEGQIVSASGGGAPVSSLSADFPLIIYGTATDPVICVAPATPATAGVVKLYNALDGTSPLLALTAQQGKVLQDQIIQVCADKVSSVSGVAPISVTAGINPAVSIEDGTTTAKGAVQLYDGLDSTSTALALTAAQGKVLQDQINAGGASPVNGWLTLHDDVTVCSSGYTAIPFTQGHGMNGIDWDVSDPTKICFLCGGLYSWNINLSYCWDAGSPNQIEADLKTALNGGVVPPGYHFISGAYTGGDTGFTTLSCSARVTACAGDFLVFDFKLNTSGALYSPTVLLADPGVRASVNIQKIG